MWVNEISHAMVPVVSPGRVLFPIAKKRVVDFGRRHIKLVLFALALQQTIQLGQTAKRQGVGDGHLRVLGQPLGLAHVVVAVARDQEARQERAQDERHEHAGDEEGVVNAVVGFLHLRGASYS